VSGYKSWRTRAAFCRSSVLGNAAGLSQQTKVVATNRERRPGTSPKIAHRFLKRQKEPIPMRTLVPQQPESPERAKAQNGSHSIVRLRPCAAARHWPALLAASAGFFAAQFLLSVTLAAQTPAPPAPTHAATHRHKKPAAGKPAAQPAPAPAPAAPQTPNWPANSKPAEASVVWDSHGLFIRASNSSLYQILMDVSLKTGAKVEGLGTDERVFGTYGPGPARDVLTELLDGSSYNILLIGDLGQGTPRRIVLSGRPVTGQPPGNAGPGATNNNDAENEQEAGQPDTNPPVQPLMPQPAQNGAPAVPVRTPQQMLEQRRLQMQQMQQQQQQNNPQNPQ
jgi:hypothetical protein